ncbi:hypothetical protein BASA62_005397 [Batrachochytrium salamandrivorans]|nr:hypothetical protein BASA62_005397 [Batrachochytrium salamandrivorans]
MRLSPYEEDGIRVLQHHRSRASIKIRQQRSKYALELRTKSGASPIGLQTIAGKPRVKCQNLCARRKAGRERKEGLSPLTVPLLVPMGLSRALKGGLYTHTQPLARWQAPLILQGGKVHISTRPLEPPISVLPQAIPVMPPGHSGRKPPASEDHTTDTHTAAIAAHPPRTHDRIWGGLADILTVLLGGSPFLALTCRKTLRQGLGQQGLTGTVRRRGNLLSSIHLSGSQESVVMQISGRVYRAMLGKHHKSNLSHIPDISFPSATLPL